MKKFSIIEPPAREFVEIALRRYGLDLNELKSEIHPQEDFLLSSNKYPIFVVADGVTLIQFFIEKKPYPNPSPAGDVARIFCKALLKAAEDKYESFTESDIKEIFKLGNKSVEKYNQEHGRTKEMVDFWNNDFYAATAAFAIIKDNIVYWGSVCDSYVAHFHGKNLSFRSPDCNAKTEAETSPFAEDSSDQKAKAKYTWSIKRNGINDAGKLVGYGVVTGEEAANRYLNFGKFEVKQDDLIAIFTDGFEDYIHLPKFISIFKDWPHNIEQHIKEFTIIKIKEDPDKFGRERSLHVISV